VCSTPDTFALFNYLEASLAPTPSTPLALTNNIKMRELDLPTNDKFDSTSKFVADKG
jgi:hypothetical protein